RRPHERALGRIEAVHRAGPAAMHELLVVMQIEAIEVDTLQPFRLLDAQDLPGEKLDGLAGAGLHHPFEQDLSGAHRLPAFWASREAAYSRNASRTSATRSGAVPCAIVRSSNSSCC